MKTAGTSLEIHLARQCGPQDVVTPIFPEVEGHFPRNHLGADGAPIFYHHMPAIEVRALLPQAFDGYFKFCFERHPVDKCLSHCALLLNSPQHAHLQTAATWDDYVRRGDFPLDVRQYVDEAGDLLVDKIYRYEEIASALADIAARTGIEDRPLAVRAKSGFRRGVPSLAEVMANRTQREAIFRAFAPSLRFADYA